MSPLNPPPSIAFLLALAMTLVASLAVARFFGPRGWMDHPEGRRQHHNPVPRTGGLALVLVGALGLWLGWMPLPLTPFQWVALGMMALLGALDDRFDLRARWKALMGLGIALVLAWSQATLLYATPKALTFMGLALPHAWALYFVLLVMAYWGLPHAFNLIDGANGLAIGFAVIVTLSLWLAGFPHPYLLGILTGLMALNWPRAFHFLGDCGSLTLGLLLSLLAFFWFANTNPNAILWLFAYPILDVTMVVVIRFLQGRNLGDGDRNHLHHQLLDRFPSLQQCAVLILWLLSAGTAAGAYAQGAWRVIPWVSLLGILLLVGVFTYLTLREHRRLRENSQPSPMV